LDAPNLLLMLAAFAGGFVDAIAGGGALITIPALLLAGFSPVAAIATNKAQAVCGLAMATFTYASGGQLDLSARLPHLAMAFIGGILGALLAFAAPTDFLRGLLPPALVILALYFALKPDAGELDRASRMTPLLLGLTVVPAIAFYDGLFGPGAGSFYTMAFVSLLGYGLLKATANARLVNLGSNAGGLLIFIAVGAIAWKTALLMAVAQIVGAWIGARLAVRSGARIIRPLLVTVCILMALRLLWDTPWVQHLAGH
jgi:uncharacterized membrane protein YfcA